jgi:hypothetical protein
MAGKRAQPQVVVDPVALAAQLEQQENASEPMASMAGSDAETDDPDLAPKLPTKTPDLLEAVAGIPADVGPSCALGHVNAAGARFCASCGLAMDAPAPVQASADRPKHASELTDQERAARDVQHAEALRAVRELDAMPTQYVPAEGESVLIHFITDGFTFAGQVWYRGQEIAIGPDHPRWPAAREWITLDRFAQLERYGKQFFDRGPWPGRQSYADGADGYEQLAHPDKSKEGRVSGPGEDALRQADEAERRRGRGVPAPLAGMR